MRKGLFARLIFRLRHRYGVQRFLETQCYRLLGAKIGMRTTVSRCRMTWPHQVRLGSRCTVEPYVSFKFDGIYNEGPSIVIGNDCFIGTGVEFNIREGISVGDKALIASGCRFIDGNHGIRDLDTPMRAQPGTAEPILLEDDVWLGANVVVLQGVNIGRGAVVGAGAVVTKSIPAYEIWAGVPAQRIRSRKED